MPPVPPVPDRLIVVGEVAALLLIVTAPVAGPAVAGSRIGFTKSTVCRSFVAPLCACSQRVWLYSSVLRRNALGLDLHTKRHRKCDCRAFLRELLILQRILLILKRSLTCGLEH